MNENTLPQATEPRLLHYIESPDGVDIVKDAPDEVIQASRERDAHMEDVVTEIRSQQLDEGRNPEADLDISDINEYIYSLGLAPPTILVLEPADVKSFEENLQVHGYSLPPHFLRSEELPIDGRYVSGLYMRDLSLALFVRNRTIEEANGIMYTKKAIVHESIHGANSHRDATYSELGPDGAPFLDGRVGFRVDHADPVDDTGAFLEEGCAEYFATKYLLDQPGYEAGILGHKFQEPDMATREYAMPSGELLPARYWHIEDFEKGQIGYETASVAAYAMELLSTVIPDFDKKLVDGRLSAEGLRNFIVSVNTLQPGLYKELRDLPRTGFGSGLIAVRNVVEAQS